MLTDAASVFHAVIALYLNAGLLDPLAVCRRVEVAYPRRRGDQRRRGLYSPGDRLA